MRVFLKSPAMSAIQYALDEICRSVTSLQMSRAETPEAVASAVAEADKSLDYAPVAHVTDAAAHASLFSAKAAATHNHDTAYAAKGVGRIEGLRYNGVANDRWYPGCMDGRTLSSLAVTANRVYAYPFSMSRALTLDGLAIDVSVLVAGNWRAAIYADGGGYPAARLLDTGSAAQAADWNSATGLALALSADTVYWLAVVLDSASAVRSPNVAAMWSVFGWGSAGGEVQGSCHCYVAPGSLTVPNPFGSFTICAPGAECPAVFMRFA